MEVERPAPDKISQKPAFSSNPVHEQALRELQNMKERRDAAREAAARVVSESAEESSSPHPQHVIPLDHVEVSSLPVLSPEDHLREEAEEDDASQYVYLGLQDEELVGEGMECRVFRGKDIATGKRVLRYEAKPGKEEYLKNQISIQGKLSGKTGFLTLLHGNEEAEHPMMICEDPGTIPLETALLQIPVNQRAQLVRQLAERLKVIHADLKMLHRDLRPDQLYVVKSADGTYQLILTDFGVAQSKDAEDQELECSLEDPSHAKTMTHFKAIFASADVAEGLSFDEQSEVEVFGKVGTFILTGLVPSYGVEKAFRRWKDQKTKEFHRLELCLKRAAEEREERYRSLEEFLGDLNALEPMTTEELQALHRIQDATGPSGIYEGLVEDIRLLEDKENPLALEPMKALKSQQNLSIEVQVALNSAIALLEKNEAGLLIEIERIREVRHREFNTEPEVTHGDAELMAYLDHPSDRVKAAAFMASGLTHANNSLITCREEVLRKAREVIRASARTEDPTAWSEVWPGYRAWKRSKDEHLNREDTILYVRMAKEGIFGKVSGLAHSLMMSGTVLEEDLDDLYEAMTSAFERSFREKSFGNGEYDDRYYWMKFFVLFEKMKRSKKAQQLMVRWIKFLEEHSLNHDDPNYEIFRELKWTARFNVLTLNYYESESDAPYWDSEALDEFHRNELERDSGSQLASNLKRLEGSCYEKCVKMHWKIVELLTKQVIEKEKMRIDHSPPETASETRSAAIDKISTLLKNIKGLQGSFGKEISQYYFHQRSLHQEAVDLAVDVLEFDGEFLTKLMNDIFETAKNDPKVKSKYKVFPFKKRGTKYYLAGTVYDKLFQRIVDRVVQENDREKFERPGGLMAYCSFQHYLHELPKVIQSICDQYADPEKSDFVTRWKRDKNIFDPKFDGDYH